MADIKFIMLFSIRMHCKINAHRTVKACSYPSRKSNVVEMFTCG